MNVPAFFPRPEAGTQLSAGWIRRRLEEPSAYHTGAQWIVELSESFPPGRQKKVCGVERAGASERKV